MRIAITICKIVEEKSMRMAQEMEPEERETFDFLREVRDCQKHVEDAKEFLSVCNKLCKA